MFRAFARGFSDVVSRPLFLLVALVGMALNLLVIVFSVDSYSGIVFDMILGGNSPDTGIFNMPFYVAANYPVDSLVILASAFASLFIVYYLVFAYAFALSGPKQGIGRSLARALVGAPAILALSAFTFVAAFLYAAIGFLLFAATLSLETVGIVALVLLLAWVVLGVYAVLKLSFTPVIMASKGSKLKEALAESWKWSSGRLIELVVFFAVLGITGLVLGSAATLVSDLTQSDVVSFVVFALGMALVNSYYNIVFIEYYASPD